MSPVCRHYAEHAEASSPDEPVKDRGENGLMSATCGRAGCWAVMPWNSRSWQSFSALPRDVMAGMSPVEHASNALGFGLKYRGRFRARDFRSCVQTAADRLEAVEAWIATRA